LEEVRLLPSGGGRYEITVDGQLVYSKAETGQHIATEDAVALVRQAVA
jgi:selT/selW/selH-like putative selenoprotein